MKRLTPVIVCLILLTGAGAGFDGVKLAFFKVDSDGRNFTISWQMDQEEGVHEYELQRRTVHTNNEFVKVKAIGAHGTNKPYQFVDDQVFKSASEQVDYRLEVVFNNGLRQILVSKSINYTPTAIRRTWGSIKAMFQ